MHVSIHYHGILPDFRCVEFCLYLKICSCESFQESIAAEFLDRLVKWCKNIKISDPFEEGCRLGPVVSKSQVCIIVTFVFLALTIPR